VADAARRLYWAIGILPPTDGPMGPRVSGTVLRVGDRSILPVHILVSVQCYEYQACECSDFAASEVARLVDAIRRHAIRRLPGYGLANWGFPGAGEVAP
jgi:hypothetical protein